MLTSALIALSALTLASAAPSYSEHHLEHDGHSHGGEQIPLGYVKFPQQMSQPIYYKNGRGHEKGAFIPGDGEVTADAIFAGIGTFAHLPYVECFKKGAEDYDIAFIGLPFDTATSYRPGARFGPAGIRQGSRRLTLYGGYNVPLDVNPFRSWAKIVDCGDVPVSPYDSAFAMKQMERGHSALMSKAAHTLPHHKNTRTGELELSDGAAKDGRVPPRLITLGGDHSITLPVLRSINKVYGPISVIHFDSHLDTWKPSVFGGSPSDTASLNHGTYFYHAAQEGLIANGTSIHAGIRTTLSGPSDYENDKDCGFVLSEAREIDTIGTEGIIEKIRNTVGDMPVYLSIDIDVLDPSAAPATGTPETGGWSTRELRTILRGLDGLNFVGADLVEVSTPYDSQAELTVQAAADVLYEVMSMMVKKGPMIA